MTNITNDNLYFSKIDIQIKEIQSVYYLTTFEWYRPQMKPRHTNGLVLFTEGCIRYYFKNETLEAHPGDILILPKGVEYSGKRLQEKNSFYVIDFETENINDLYQLSLPYIFKADNYDVTLSLFQRTLKAYESSSQNSLLKCRSLLYNLLDYLFVSNSQVDAKNKRIHEYTNYLRKQIANEDFDMTQFSDYTGLSTSHIRKLFKDNFGISPMHYLHSLRIQHAKELLRYDGISIQSIAQQCGYRSLYFFSKDFKKSTGYSPTQYRNNF